jgi:hypothetical protein
MSSAFGPVRAMTRHDEAIVYLDVACDVESIQAGWPAFESRLPSLRGRVLMAAVYPERGIYRLATQMQGDDDPDALGLRMGLLPGGPCLQLSLEGGALAVHRAIGPAFEELHGMGARDPARPCLEVYLSAERVDVFLPLLG